VRGFSCLANVRYWPLAACQKLNSINVRPAALGRGHGRLGSLGQPELLGGIAGNGASLDGCEVGQFLGRHVYPMCTSLNGPKAEKLKLLLYMVGPGGLEPLTKGL
jgi:hypothetical protein